MVTCSEIKSIRVVISIWFYSKKKRKLPDGETESLKILDTKERLKQIRFLHRSRVGVVVIALAFHQDFARVMVENFSQRGFFPAMPNQIFFYFIRTALEL